MAIETLDPAEAPVADSEGLWGPHAAVASFEFRDVSFHAQVAMGVVGAVAVAAVVGAVKMGMAGQPAFFVAAGAAAVAGLAALGFVYWKFGQPAGLRLCGDELVLLRKGAETVLPLNELAALRTEWTDYSTNGVYQHTRVRFQFASEEPASAPLTYDAQATFGAPKFEQLEQFQWRLAEVVGRRMHEELTRAGRVSWTEKLAFTAAGLEIANGPTPRLVPYERLSRWEVDQGLFKLATEGGARPDHVEKANQWNFYPGLLLLESLARGNER